MTVHVTNRSNRVNRAGSVLGFAILGVFAVPFVALPAVWFYIPLWYEHGVRWTPVTGELEEASLVESKMKGMSYGYELHASYRYTSDGTEMYGDRVGFAPVYKVATANEGNEIIDGWRSRDSIEVYVDTSDPNRSVLVQHASGRMWAVPAVVFSVVGVGLALCALFTLLRPLLPKRIGGLS